MQKDFSEIVIEGPFILVKGFLMGFLYGSNEDFKYFFHRKHGIRRETFREFIKEFFELDSYVHLCLENSVLKKFLTAIEESKEKISLEVKSIQKIKSASFSFSYEIFNEELANETKMIFDTSPAGVHMSDYHTSEETENDAIGVEGYAPVHSFVSRGSGKTDGDFLEVMELYLKIKKSKASESIICKDIFLDLE